MSSKAFELWLKLNDGLHVRSHVNVIVIYQRCGLKFAQDSSSVRIGAMNHYDFCVAKVTENFEPHVGLMVVGRNRSKEGDVYILIGESCIAR